MIVFLTVIVTIVTVKFSITDYICRKKINYGTITRT